MILLRQNPSQWSRRPSITSESRRTRLCSRRIHISADICCQYLRQSLTITSDELGQLTNGTVKEHNNSPRTSIKRFQNCHSAPRRCPSRLEFRHVQKKIQLYRKICLWNDLLEFWNDLLLVEISRLLARYINPLNWKLTKADPEGAKKGIRESFPGILEARKPWHAQLCLLIIFFHMHFPCVAQEHIIRRKLRSTVTTFLNSF